MELDIRGITGIGVFAFGTLLLARSFIQDQVSASSCEAEYYSYSSAVNDREYVTLLLSDLFPVDASPPSMLVDSAPAMAISQGPTNRSRIKHIDFTMALARDYIQRGRAVMEQLICGPSSLVQVLTMSSRVVSRGLFLSCVFSLMLFAIVSSR